MIVCFIVIIATTNKGYATATNVKFLVMVKSPSEPKLKTMFSRIHEQYVHYTMNPFSKIQGKVVSKRFNQGVRDAVAEYRSSKKAVGFA